MLIKTLRFGQDYTAQVNFGDLAGATEVLRLTNAVNEPDGDKRLALPSSLRPSGR